MLPEWGTLSVGVRGHWQTWEQGNTSRLGDIAKEGSERGRLGQTGGHCQGLMRGTHTEMGLLPVGRG